MKQILMTFAVLTALSSAALAALQHDHPSDPKGAHTAATKKALICPVTGTKIASIKAAVGHSTYKGKTYYFCCPECKPRFDKTPAKIVKNAAANKYEKM